MRKLSPIVCLCILSLCMQAVFINDAFAYPNEVRWSGSSYIWRTDNVDRGSTSSLATAINNCMNASREIHILTGGSLNATLTVRATNVKLYCHGNTFTRNFSGTGVINTYSGFEIHDMILRGGSNGYGIRSSRASNLKFINVQVYDCPWIGIRVDSRESEPWNYWIYNLEVKNCVFDGMGSHGLETYSVDGFVIDGIIARNTGECGVLLNQSRNGTVGSVDCYRCATGTGYAALRFANSCSNITANTLVARESGRGYFVLSGSNNCHLNFAKITDGTGVGVWLENVVNCTVKSGCTNDGVAVTGSGSWANVSNSTTCTLPVAGLTIQENTTGFCSVNGTIDNNNAGFTGTGFINTNNAVGAGAVWRINVPAAGSYTLTWRHANGGGANRPARLLANGTQILSTINFNATTNWTTWADVSVNVNLSAGQNTLRLESTTAAGTSNIDYLRVNGNNVTAVSCSGVAGRMQTEEMLEQTSDEETASVDVSPNPTTGLVTITLPDSYKDGEKGVNLMDGTGKTAVSEKFSGLTHTMNIGTLSSGMYVLKVTSNKKLILKKVIKK